MSITVWEILRLQMATKYTSYQFYPTGQNKIVVTC